MANVHVDFETLRILQTDMANAAISYKDVQDALARDVNNLSDGYGWNDPVADSFREVFRKTEEDFNQLQELLIGFQQYLGGKIQILEQYHSQKLSF